MHESVKLQERVVDNLQRNQYHYDNNYCNTSVNTIVNKVNNEGFLIEATNTDSSWYAMYQGAFAKRITNKRVLELGCGDGLNALIMARLGANVVGLDISKQSERIIREATAKLHIKNIQPITGDFCQIPFTPKSFDYIIGKAFLHHLTHETEKEYLKKVSLLLKPDGEARFFEPAMNSLFLEKLRWIVPVPGRPSRPSSLARRRFEEWKAKDPHPERHNSSDHFVRTMEIFFKDIQVTPMGSIERLCRLMPYSKFSRCYQRWAHRVELRLPDWFNYYAARSQLIVCREPLEHPDK